MEEKLANLKEYIYDFYALSDHFSTYSRLYNMTTENILEFLNSVDCKDKKVLTVTGSGDQALNCILKGSRDITCFDINPYSFNQFKLKEASIKTLSFEEFLTFFKLQNNSDLNKFLTIDLFNKVACKLDNETIKLFEFLYNFYDNDTKEIFENIYYHFSYHLDHMKNMCNYLNEEDYYKLSNILNTQNTKIDFLKTDFTELHNYIKNEKFDLIMFSNISDYIHNMYDGEAMKCYYDDVMLFKDNLNNCGIMQVGYIYTHPTGFMMTNLFCDKELRENYFDPSIFNIIYVTAYEDIYNQYTDKIITYKKTK